MDVQMFVWKTIRMCCELDKIDNLVSLLVKQLDPMVPDRVIWF